MSIRPREEDGHVHVKGTMVSTAWTRPSTLHVSVVQAFGMPNVENKIFTDRYVLHLTYDRTDDALVRVWAQPRSETPPIEESWRRDGCALS